MVRSYYSIRKPVRQVRKGFPEVFFASPKIATKSKASKQRLEGLLHQEVRNIFCVNLALSLSARGLLTPNFFEFHPNITF